MTKEQIERIFKDMLLEYNSTDGKGRRINHSYWTVPVEIYQFRLVPILPRDNWAIELTSTSIKQTFEAEEGIRRIQDLIRDKMEEQVDRIDGKNIATHTNGIGWMTTHEVRTYKRHTALLWRNQSFKETKNGKKDTVF